MSQIKMRVAVAGLLLIVSVTVALVSQLVHAPLALLLLIQFPFAFGAFWFFLARLKCPHCGRKLSQDFPVGALVALPFANQLCKQCGREL